MTETPDRHAALAAAVDQARADRHDPTPLPQLCDVRGSRCCGTPACLNAGTWHDEAPA